ncbi:MAG: magnesium/cobalt transporter CorA [Nitrospinae bacterium]|nr:magnesium/cobalt transporter CorA [Nitrospinota bacterium]
MARKHHKRRAKKSGMPPGTLLAAEEFVEETPQAEFEASRITILEYDEKYFHAEQTYSVDVLPRFRDSATITWINMDAISDARTLERIGAVFNLHPLTLEDIQSLDQRPKMDDYDDYLYLDLKILGYDTERNEITSEAFSLALGPTWVLTFHERESGALNAIRDRIRASGGRIRKMGADYLAYCLMDAIVDQYFLVLEKLDERIEILQDEVMSNPTSAYLRELNSLKQEIILLRKSVWPLRDVIVKMERSDSGLIKEATTLYLRDIYDHTVHIIDTIETLRDLISGMLDVYLSSSNNRLNEVIKFLTIISTIFIPLTFLAGVYGMNFHHFPELNWEHGYLYFWIINLGIAGGMLYYFKRKGWL